jgi:hypothetical protein
MYTDDHTFLRRYEPLELEVPRSSSLYMLSPSPEHLNRLKRPERRNVWRVESNVRKLLSPIQNAHFDRTRGQGLLDILATMPPERAALGPTALPLATLGQYCEHAGIEFSVEHQGETYDAVYAGSSYLNASVPVNSLYALSSTCTDALRTSHGAVTAAVGAGCTREDEAAHFPAGSACRSCLQTDGDHARCVSSTSCEAEMNREVELVVAGETKTFDVIEFLALACAPNFFVEMFALVEELGENNTLPAAFDMEAYHEICAWHWNPGIEEPRPYCRGATGPIKATINDTVMGGVERITRRSTGEERYRDRLYLASSVQLEGVVLESWMNVDLNDLSHPTHAEGGWGLNPQDLRPDGTDPNNIDHTRARDWISLLSLKTATTRNGVPIAVFNHNLCADDAWQGPDEQGRYHCVQPGWDATNPPPMEDQWSYDWGSFNGQGGTIELYPVMTLASTGLMDPGAPVPHFPHILGSATLANPSWDNCAWKDQFFPDEMANFDTRVPEGIYNITTQTYRFGKTDKFDIRLGLSTNQRRGFCSPEFPDL